MIPRSNPHVSGRSPGRRRLASPHHQKEEIDPYRTLGQLGGELGAASSQAVAGSDRLGKNRGEQRGADRQGGGKPHGLEEETHDWLHSAHIRCLLVVVRISTMAHSECGREGKKRLPMQPKQK